ncbi:3-oxoacyl-ACP synthase III family protein [Desnuesiella massiliensis]|uniref:3-oxoacyl-ACP synthase III family protein n=1 Tax=Desnuesiella massiliensis TaxID=1650662 RepID=UPI0006E217D4|nr:ketoacyl-ACP synthase III [Desnuesiella massiliensis]
MLKEMYSAGIIGVGAYIPEIIRKNDYWDGVDFVNLTKKNKNVFQGIEERRVFPEGVLPSDAEARAGMVAIEDSGLKPEDIDLVMVHSMIQDELIPGNASLVQYKLGLKNAAAWNVDTCCSSFVTMVVNAANLIATGEFKNILIVTSVFHSWILDRSDYLAAPIGDGAGAVLMSRVPDGKGYIASTFNSDGYYHDAFTLTERLPYDVTKRKHCEPVPMRPYLTTNAAKTREMGQNSVDDMCHLLSKVLEKADIKSEDIDLFLSHQPCHWAHDAWREFVGIPKEKSYETFSKYGNMASSVIPINMYEAKRKGLLRDGYNVLIASPGAGKNNSVAVLKWHDTK